MDTNPAVEELVEHIKNCMGVDASIVVDGNADSLIENLEASGEWRFTGRVEYVAGKRIRIMERVGDAHG